MSAAPHTAAATALPRDLSARVEDRILAPLALLRRRARSYLALDGGVRFVLALILAGLGQLLLDRWLKLSLDQRAVLNIAITFAWLCVAWRYLLRPLLRAIPDHALAAAVDRANPRLADQLATAVQFAEGRVGAPDRNSPALVRAVLDDACESAAGVSFLDVLNHRAARRSAVEIGGLLLVVLLAFIIITPTMSTWFRRNWLMQELPWPQDVHITPLHYDSDGKRRVPEGDELEIVAEVISESGEPPDRITLEWWSGSNRSGSEAMSLVGKRAAASLGVLTENVSFRILGGDERTREYTAIAVQRPAVTKTVAHITPPAYTGLDPVELEQQTVLEVLKGATLRIEADLNKPVRSAKFVGPAGETGKTALERAERVVVDLAEPDAGAYIFELVDLDGWENRRNLRYTLKVVPDLAPVVRLTLKDVGDAVTPTAEIPLEIAFNDVYGLGRIALMAQRGEDPPTEIPLPDFAAPQRDYQSEQQLAVASLAVKPGERIRLWAEAADTDPSGPNVGRSQPVELRVLTPADLAAELAAREQEMRQEFERLISEQNGLKAALDTLIPLLPESGAMPAGPAQRLAGLARRQEGYAGRVLSLRRGFAQILAEMRTSMIARSADERRINDRIATPMEEVGGKAMPDAVQAMTELRREADRAAAERLPLGQADIVRQMRAILTNMLELEGFREAVALLQEIIAEQTAVRADTATTLSDLLDDIIGPDESMPHSSPARP